MASDSGSHSRLIGFLAALCHRRAVAEKWIFAPSLRVGQQWLDAVARSGQPVLNARLVSIKHLALDLAAPEMDRKGRAFLGRRRAELLIGRVFARLRSGRQGYLWQLEPGRGVIQALHRTLEDLRHAGVGISQLADPVFEVALKGSEIQALLSEYLAALKQRRLWDYAQVLEAARERVEREPSAVAAGVILARPADLALNPLEIALWESLPRDRRRILPVDGPSGETDARRLSYFLCPEDAPPSLADGTVQMFRAVGEVNETREVLRRCAAEGIALDQVEVLHGDTDLYNALFFENAATYLSEDPDAPAMTFAEGVPARYSRAGRALRAWIEWIQQDCSQRLFSRMLQDGLLRLPEEVSSQRLSVAFAALPVSMGRGRYLTSIDRRQELAERRLAGGRLEAAEARPEERLLEDLAQLRELLSRVLELTPRLDSDELEILGGAHRFLETLAPSAGRLDEYSRRKLLREVEELTRCIEAEGAGAGINIWEWLEDLATNARVGGQGPRPGCLHVANLSTGGHTGRPYTFILGFDDGRFPGSGIQDPILLDRERRKISEDLPTATGRMTRRLEELAGLLSRLRGHVTLSYSCRDLDEDREQFPSSFLLTAYRMLSRDPGGDADALLEYLGAPASFAPGGPVSCLAPVDWWLWQLCQEGAVSEGAGLIERVAPTLGRGMRALRERASDRFTKYDGHVPEAGADFDPTADQGPVLSASQLEKMGTCPLDFFMQYLLGIEPPDPGAPDPEVWLDPMQRGLLIHDLFCEFMRRLLADQQQPSLELHLRRIRQMVVERADRLRRWTPPPSEAVYQREVQELQRVALIFLRDEERYSEESTPFSLEVSVGLAPDGEGTALDTTEPCEVRLPGGGRVRFRGRIDRLDRLRGPGVPRFAIWDYKTGSAWKYHPLRPFQQGRVVQGAIYLALVQARLQAVVDPDAVVSTFGYFFPNTREFGLRLAWTAEELAAGGEILARLCQLIKSGCFPPSDDPSDLQYSAYLAAYGDPRAVAERSRVKIDNPANATLTPLRELRRGEVDHGG